jgi:phosphoribosylanthranilate isomerase
MSEIKVKICCIKDAAEARLAMRYGAAALGLVSEMPSGPGPISEHLIGVIADTIPTGVASFLLTSRQSASDIILQHPRCRTTTIQICDDFPVKDYADLRRALPGVSLVQVIHVTGEQSVQQAVTAAPFVDAILLDSGNQKSTIKQLGGTGRRHDWAISRRIRDSINVPVYLAGGLSADNVAEAIKTVNPYAVDLCNGVRTQGRLDEKKLAAFFNAVRVSP